MRLLQLCLKDQWDFLDDQFQVSWSLLCREDLLWWSKQVRLREGVSLSLPAPDISFFSDASDVGWGALVGEHHASGLWLPHQKALSINMRGASGSSARPSGLRASHRGQVGSAVLRQHHHSSLSSSVGRDLFVHPELHGKRGSSLGGGTTTFVSFPSSSWGRPTSPPTPESPESGDRSEWTLHQEVVDQLVHRWPAVIDLFATALTARLPVYFSPASDPRAAGTDALLQPWDDLQAYAFPPIAIIRRVLLKLRSSKNCELTLIAPFWPQRDWFPDLLELLSDVPITLSDRKDLLRQPPLPPVPPKSTYASADCMATLKRFAIQAGFSPAVAGQLIFSRRLSTRLNYQARWGTYRKWCRDFGHRSSSPTIAKVADFLTYMFKAKGAALSTIKGYRAMLAAVF